MAAPFLDKGIPVFIDKPLTDNAPDLEAFQERYRDGQPFLSTSCFRYCKELKALAGRVLLCDRLLAEVLADLRHPPAGRHP